MKITIEIVGDILTLENDIGAVTLSEKNNALDFHLSKSAIYNFGEMITRHLSGYQNTLRRNKDMKIECGFHLCFTNTDPEIDAISKVIWHPNLASAERGKKWLEDNKKGCNIKIFPCKEEKE